MPPMSSSPPSISCDGRHNKHARRIRLVSPVTCKSCPERGFHTFRVQSSVQRYLESMPHSRTCQKRRQKRFSVRHLSDAHESWRTQTSLDIECFRSSPPVRYSKPLNDDAAKKLRGCHGQCSASSTQLSPLSWLIHISLKCFLRVCPPKRKSAPLCATTACPNRGSNCADCVTHSQSCPT